MSKQRWVGLAALALASGWLWGVSALRSGSLLAVFDYAAAGILAGLALVWIFRSFASLPNDRSSVFASAVIGAFLFTPLVAILFGRTDQSQSSAVVLALLSGAVASIAGAIRGVATLAHDAFGDWRQERLGEKHQFNFGGVHR